MAIHEGMAPSGVPEHRCTAAFCQLQQFPGCFRFDDLVSGAGQLSEAERQRVLDEAAGLWRDHDDLPDWQELRISWDRHLIDQQRLPKG